MASLASLKASMTATVVLIFAVLFALVAIVATVADLALEEMRVSLYARLIVALIFTAFFVFVQWAIGPAVVRWSTGMRYLKPGEYPWLEREVSELARQAGIPMPRLGVVQNRSPNAFVFGRTLSSATLAVHTGLLERLNKEEVRAVLAHEVGHLKHRDVIVMTLAGSIPLIAYMLARVLFFGSGGRNERNAGALIVVGLLAFGVYAVSQLLVLRLSRMREFYADTYSATATGKPRTLASALAKIAYGLSLAPKEDAGAARAFYIGDPQSARSDVERIREIDLNRDGVLDDRELQLAMEKDAKGAWSRVNESFSTHPSTYKRILLLMEIDKDLK